MLEPSRLDRPFTAGMESASPVSTFPHERPWGQEPDDRRLDQLTGHGEIAPSQKGPPACGRTSPIS